MTVWDAGVQNLRTSLLLQILVSCKLQSSKTLCKKRFHNSLSMSTIIRGPFPSNIPFSREYGARFSGTFEPVSDWGYRFEIKKKKKHLCKPSNVHQLSIKYTNVIISRLIRKEPWRSGFVRPPPARLDSSLWRRTSVNIKGVGDFSLVTPGQF